MASCITDFLCTLLMLIHIGLYSPLLFYKIIKYCNSSLQTSNMQMYWGGGGRGWYKSSQLKGKDSSSLFSHLLQTVTLSPLPTPSPRVALILIPRLLSERGKLKKKESKGLSNVFMYSIKVQRKWQID